MGRMMMRGNALRRRLTFWSCSKEDGKRACSGRMRFGERKTLAETAEQFGVTRERIRQIESMTISLLFRRQQWARKKIRNFYE